MQYHHQKYAEKVKSIFCYGSILIEFVMFSLILNQFKNDRVLSLLQKKLTTQVRSFMSMSKLLVYLGSVTIAASINSLSLSAEALVPQQLHATSSQGISVAIAAADQTETAKKTNALLIANGILARKIAAHLGIESNPKEPPAGDVFQQNLFLILQNQDTFRAIAAKVGATAAPAGPVEGEDQSAKNHSILLTNKKIVGAILKKLGITPTPPTLTGTFEEKNVTLLMGNRKALDKIAAKLGVK